VLLKSIFGVHVGFEISLYRKVSKRWQEPGMMFFALGDHV